MKGNFKKNLAFVFFLLAGIAVGSFIAYLCEGNSFLDWLSWGQSIGIGANSPVTLDLIIIKLTFGISLKVTISQIFTVILALFAYSKTCKSL